jgi:hypothetical protein
VASGWLASTATLLGLGEVQARTATASAQGQQLEGSWLVTVSTPNNLITFISDGSLVGTTNMHPTQSPFHGTWVRTGDRQFAYTHWRFRSDSDGANIGSQKVYGELTLNETLDQYAARAVVEDYDRDGNLMRATTTNPLGQRITVELMP